MREHDLASLEADLRAEIDENKILKQLSQGALSEVLSAGSLVLLSQGDILFSQDDMGDSFFLVLGGRLSASVATKGGGSLTVGEIGPGEFVGEMPLISGCRRSATIRAATESRLLKLPGRALALLASDAPKIVADLHRIVRTRLMRSSMATKLPKLFGPLSEKMLQDIETEIEWCRLERGQVLFGEKEPGDSLYILLRGRMRAVADWDSGSERIVGEIAPGESVGEMAVLTGDPRTATIYAIRDSELLRISQAAFENIVARYPQVMRNMTKIVIDRLRKTILGTDPSRTERNIAVIPVGSNIPLEDFARRLVNALSGLASTQHVSSQRAINSLNISETAAVESDAAGVLISRWLDDIEAQYRFVVYEADTSLTSWTRRCLSRADDVLLVAWADGDPALTEIERDFLAGPGAERRSGQTLVLLHRSDRVAPKGSRVWLSPRQLKTHLHVCWESDRDFARLARVLSGEAVGLVLSGGGARALAHIGVLRALTEAGIPVDFVGGTSMGAFIASQCAMLRDFDSLVAMIRDEFLPAKPFSDFTLPFISLLRGQKLEMAIRIISEDMFIEDLWINFFCVSTNLSSAEEVIHREGPLWKAIRATTAIPGIMAPVLRGHELLVDGALLNNLPSDIMRSTCQGKVIAVDVGVQRDITVDFDALPSPWEILLNKALSLKNYIEVPNIITLMARTTMLNSISRSEAVRRTADLYLKPPVEKFKLFDFAAVEELVDIGYQYAREQVAKYAGGKWPEV